VFSARSAKMPMHATINTATEDRCFLCGPCLNVKSRTTSESYGSEKLVGELVRELRFSLVHCCCWKMVAEARGQFGNPEEAERPPLKAVTRQQLKTQQTEEI
jgi:hypothetical protein